MKIKFMFSFLLLAALVLTGCTRYASASPTPPPAAATEETKFEMPTPTLMALEVEVATRTPIPLVLKTATPTSSVSEILTTTPAEGETSHAGGEMETGEATTTGEGGEVHATESASGALPTLSGYKTTAVATSAAAPIPTRMPQVVLSGEPTVEIVHVKYADSITLNLSKLPVNAEFGIRMGSVGTYGADGIIAQTLKSDASGKASGTIKIPANMQGYGSIGVRIEYPNAYYVSFYFNNMDY
jgi:hypothetical protein